jgi:hypothetical protein
MFRKILIMGALTLASAPSVSAFAADAAGAAAPNPPAAVNAAPPDKVAPNGSNTPGVFPPKATPPADEIKPSAKGGGDTK